MRQTAFGASDASGAWSWKRAYDTCEAALVLFLRQYGPALLRKAGSPEAALPMLERLGALMPSHTRRSEESRDLQQFSTPLALGLAAVSAAAITPTDLVLEPSAGTGLLAALAGASGSALMLNERAGTRAGLLAQLFPDVTVTRFDAAQIDDYLPAEIAPSVVLMNPPFSAMAHV
ncbi:MAG: methylase, partial [Paracoccus sp. (in: a-proteobacteria)]|nr:methylase [Paracoccus sp. (in: a-proteobacteria)]